MNKVKVVKKALATLLDSEAGWKTYHYYSCNLLQFAALYLAKEEEGRTVNVYKCNRELGQLQEEYAALFDDATFWIETRQGREGIDSKLRPRISECNFDRACCLLMFAEILQDEPDA